jgi:hypothetical protein
MPDDLQKMDRGVQRTKHADNGKDRKRQGDFD